MKKRILIDATTVTSITDGLSQYIINLLKNFPEEAFNEFDFSVLVNKGVDRKELWEVLNSGRFGIVESSIAPIGPKRDRDMFFFYRKNKKYFDTFHSTSNQYPLCIPNGIATIHDITFRFYFDKPWWTFRAAQRYLNLVIKNSLKKAGSVIAVSHSTRNMLIDSYKVNKQISDKIEVIYEGWEHLVRDTPVKDETENEYGHYIFYVGTTRKHKNMKKLLKAFSIAKDSLPPDVNLVLSGSETYLDSEDAATIAKINEKTKRVIFTGYVAKEKLDSLFRHSDAFIFPSLCEGFGIPVLESFYFGKPLLCSNTTSLPEIAGDAALYFNPESTEDMAAAMIRFYENPAMAAELVEKGKRRLQDFSWKKAAAETIELYKRHFKK